MKDFQNIQFHGVFRDYQQAILNNITNHTKDNKIHIVAPPGSGKTILGLELIRRLNQPCIIFSPTITIRQQWLERFQEKFLNSDEDVLDYLSTNLMDLKLITSVTYQSLHAAINKQKEVIEDELDGTTEEVDYSKFDLITAIRNHNVKTICLDEAHHLHNEWQASLEKFIHALAKDVTIIALTATPPYDSNPSEWNKYIALCGEIDEEIPVTELVNKETLCPHQDYVYFNYPTESEIEELKKYKQTVNNTVEEVLNSAEFQKLIRNINSNNEEYLIEHAKEYIALFTLAKSNNIHVPQRLIKLVSPSGKLPHFKLTYAEVALQFIIDNSQVFSKELSEKIKDKLKTQGLIERGKVKLVTNEKLTRLLISSIGKLNSIVDIAHSEYTSLGKDLRMVILTDYIRKNMVKFIGTEDMPKVMGIVSIFDRLLHNLPDVPIGVVSGALVILPNNLIEQVSQLSISEGIELNVKNIPNTNYSEVDFKGKNKNKVMIITKLFEAGHLNILIGTKSLLVEGWDSPCINSLILASFIGSFVQSNQMRGRAIRVDKNNPNKTANIWHLVTIEPTDVIYPTIKGKLLAYIFDNKNQIVSTDYEILQRRFASFIGPSYSKNVIESGIDRLDVIKPPFNEAGIKKINAEMLELSRKRDEMRKSWFNVLQETSNQNLVEMDEISEEIQPKRFVLINGLNAFILSNILISLIWGFINVPLLNVSFLNGALYLITISVVIYYCVFAYYKLLNFISPINTIKTLGRCILLTLQDIGEIKSPHALVRVKAIKDNTCVEVYLENATTREEGIFVLAMRELLSAIDNPRYLIIKKYPWGLSYYLSYACPSIIGTNKNTVRIFQDHLEKRAGKFILVYTRSAEGRKLILKCRRWSYISQNERFIKQKKKLSKWE
ncbi:MAG: DEAD/DEAH box helicase family protein [Bacilli bacterium]|nr:DEAD/DEAH box helicase family protein [Bacilli bacterium]